MSFVSSVQSLLTFTGESSLLLADASRKLLRRPFERREVVSQMAFVGVNSVPIVALTTFFSGSVLALYTAEVLVRYGATSLAGGTIGLSVTREIAPVLAGIMVAARCGSAMAAQIGTMQVTEQVDALRALNVDPVQYLVVPRLIASVIMVPVLTMVGMYAGIIGGYLVSIQNGVAAGAFMNSIKQFVEPSDFVGGLVKALVFGLIIAIVSAQQGLRTKDGAVGVGRSTTGAVVISMILIYVANFFLTSLLY